MLCVSFPISVIKSSSWPSGSFPKWSTGNLYSEKLAFQQSRSNVTYSSKEFHKIQGTYIISFSLNKLYYYFLETFLNSRRVVYLSLETKHLTFSRHFSQWKADTFTKWPKQAVSHGMLSPSSNLNDGLGRGTSQDPDQHPFSKSVGTPRPDHQSGHKWRMVLSMLP